ncbi:Lrp/AsnC family transcriptional regulator [Roseateles chitinivorans]|uniref:Lrp/AsnC family transcriptional regulator n=1 Tax=Roseateles chitinivorans TaxID=2917965 RepID=UPI001E4B5F8D|nr:Lrp/AsnC family transcriptional regulator [Roseateles chitinivorans]
MEQQIKLDKFDRAILRALQRNARASLQEVSEEVGLTTSPCWTRIKRLEESGVIEGYTVKVNAEKIGRPEQLIVQLTLNKHTDAAMAEFARHLEAIPEVIDAYLVSGDYDYVLRLSVRDTRDYERLLREKLYKIPGVRHSKSSFVLRCLKASSLPL